MGVGVVVSAIGGFGAPSSAIDRPRLRIFVQTQPSHFVFGLMRFVVAVLTLAAMLESARF